MRDLTITTRVVREYFTALDCSKSLAAWLLFNYEEYDQLLDLSFNPSDYNDLSSARDSLAAVSYLSKATFLGNQNSDLLRDRALEKFYAAERECTKTNKRLIEAKCFEPEMFSATRKISSILGSFVPEEFIDSCMWGPGSTLDIRADRATAATKFDANVEVTPACYNFVKNWIPAAYPLWFEGFKFRFAKANKVITVPKTSKIDRVIAVEPSLNLWFQKGVGTMIRKRLKRNGIDLNDQGHNQRLSRIASKFNKLATVDFSSASDTISSNLVLQLLPGDWLNVICALRSPHGNIRDSLNYEYEKFSSMGNGFTFELESLIFLTIAMSCCGEDADQCSIYGDDLIIPSVHYHKCVEVFEFCGFKINPSKSYADTYYCESCGKHWWNGVDITPIYQKEEVQDEASCYKAHNALRRYSHRLLGYGCDSRFSSVCLFIRRASKTFVKRPLLISDKYGDGGFIVNLDEAKPSYARHGHEGYLIRILIEKPYERWTDSHGLLLSRLWCTIGSDRSYKNCEILPRRTRSKTVRSLIAVWHDLGPWI
jgi:hypothetical protein